MKKSRVFFILLCLAFIGVSVGRAYQCIFWDIPIRSLLWKEEWMTSVVTNILGLSWEDYLKHPQADSSIQCFVSVLGYLLVLTLIMALIQYRQLLTRLSLYTSFIILTFIAFLYHLEKFQTAGQFFEYSLQFTTPWILWSYLKSGVTKKWIVLVKVAVALTFTSHGLYALGFYPVPVHFVSMTIQILPFSQGSAVSFLFVIGIIDIICSIGLFTRGVFFKLSLWYCIIWGGLTTAARIMANVDVSMMGSTLHQWWYQSMYRLPHFIFPILLYLVCVRQEKGVTEKG